MCSPSGSSAEALGALRAAVDALLAASPAPELVHDLLAQQQRLDAVVLGWLRAVEDSQVWRADGAVTAAGWLRETAGLAHADAARRLALGRALEELPVVREALRAGR